MRPQQWRNVNSALSHSECKVLRHVLKICSLCFHRSHRSRGFHTAATQPLSVKVTVYSKFSFILSICSLAFSSSGLEAVDTVEQLEIVAAVTDTGDETLMILTYPWRGFQLILLWSMPKGAQSSFTSIKLKYVPETAVSVRAYTTLAPGESVAVEHEGSFHPRLSCLVCHVIISPPSRSYAEPYCL